MLADVNFGERRGIGARPRPRSGPGPRRDIYFEHRGYLSKERENRMGTYLYRLGRFVTRRRRLVVSAWLALLAGVIALAVGSGGKTVDSFTVPGTQSQQATDLLAKRIPAFAGAHTQVVFATSGPANVTESVYRTILEAALAHLPKAPHLSLAT